MKVHQWTKLRAVLYSRHNNYTFDVDGHTFTFILTSSLGFLRCCSWVPLHSLSLDSSISMETTDWISKPNLWLELLTPSRTWDDEEEEEDEDFGLSLGERTGEFRDKFTLGYSLIVLWQDIAVVVVDVPCRCDAWGLLVTLSDTFKLLADLCNSTHIHVTNTGKYFHSVAQRMIYE